MGGGWGRVNLAHLLAFTSKYLLPQLFNPYILQQGSLSEIMRILEESAGTRRFNYFLSTECAPIPHSLSLQQMQHVDMYLPKW